MNLVVHPMRGGKFGADDGERRRLALGILLEEGRTLNGVPVTAPSAGRPYVSWNRG